MDMATSDVTQWRKINESQLDRGLKMLFEETLTKEETEAFKELAREMYGRQHCIAWWYSEREDGESKFTTLCKRLGVNPGRREIIINDNNSLLYTGDYVFRPEIV